MQVKIDIKEDSMIFKCDVKVWETNKHVIKLKLRFSFLKKKYKFTISL